MKRTGAQGRTCWTAERAPVLRIVKYSSGGTAPYDEGSYSGSWWAEDTIGCGVFEWGGDYAAIIGC
jgi:hypothetical protein